MKLVDVRSLLICYQQTGMKYIVKKRDTPSIGQGKLEHVDLEFTCITEITVLTLLGGCLQHSIATGNKLGGNTSAEMEVSLRIDWA